MFKNLSLHFKLILAFLFIALLLAGASFYQIRSVQHFNRLFLNLIDDDFKRLSELENMELLGSKIHNEILTYQHEALEGDLEATQKGRANLSVLTANLNTNEQTYRSLVQTDTASSQVNSTQIDAITKNTGLFIQKTQAVTTTTAEGKALEVIEDEVTLAKNSLDQSLSDTITAEQKGVATEDKEVDESVTNLIRTIVILATTMTVTALVLGVLVASWIARSLSRLKKGADYIANGDFTHPITVSSHDEIGQLGTAFNSMSERLKDAYHRQAIIQQRDEAILLSMGEGLIALDEMGRTVLINRVAAEFFHIKDESSVIGKSIEEAIREFKVNDKNDKPLAPEQAPSYRTLKDGETMSDTFIFHAADDRKILFDINSSPIKLKDKIVGAVVIFRDVTKEKEVDRMKTEFISLASHQLRTPLSAIRWYSEMLVSGDAGKLMPEQLDFATNISDSTVRMIGLVNALLNIARIESGRIMVDPKPTDLKELVSGIVTDLKAKTEEKQQTLIISVHDELPKINLDPRLISQVYMNLLTNAIKYSPKGSEISVFISRKGDQIISQVTDNGYGIPKAQQARIFEKFFRAANAVKVETDGTGLGLYLIKSVVESSGGKIWFESEEGKGTTFWFSMPLTGMIAKEGEVTLDA